jgi:hypothetical protein
MLILFRLFNNIPVTRTKILVRFFTVSFYKTAQNQLVFVD